VSRRSNQGQVFTVLGLRTAAAGMSQHEAASEHVSTVTKPTTHS